VALASSGSAEAADDRLEVVVQPESTATYRSALVHEGGGFELFYSLRNGSREAMSLGLWSCSHSLNWESTVQWVQFDRRRVCHANTVETIVLAPGQMQLGAIHITIAPNVPAGTLTYRMKFLSYHEAGERDGRQWLSNEVSLHLLEDP
jgi:hypothetical protein